MGTGLSKKHSHLLRHLPSMGEMDTNPQARRDVGARVCTEPSGQRDGGRLDSAARGKGEVFVGFTEFSTAPRRCV